MTTASRTQGVRSGHRWPSPATWIAASAWAGALVGVAVSPLVGVAVGATGWLRRRTPLVCLGALLLTGALADRTDRALEPLDHGHVSGEATIVSDPQWFGPSLRVDLRIDGDRVEAWARGPAAGRLAPRLTGERIEVSGRDGPPPPDAPWLAHRHVVGRMSVESAGEWRPGDPVSRAANGFRRTVEEGTTPMDRDTRSLYVGLLFGDTRTQSPAVADAFRGAGLSHLLAVSGMNVAFVLALVGPVLRRLGLVSRLAATLGVLGFFALITRFTPSVLRAATMAGFAAMAVTFGRESDSRRTLALAVTTLVVIDPMIVHQLAFQLSVAATTGILLWSRRLAELLPLPEPLANAMGMTVAAQLAVAPLLIPVFGGMPVAALVANLLAAPMAGPVVVWGFPAGIVAGIFGGRVAELVHLPTTFFVNWIGAVAERCALLPLGEIRTEHLIVALVGSAVVWSALRIPARAVTAVGVTAGVVLVVGALAHPGLALRHGPPPVDVLADGSRVHHLDGAVVVELDVGARADVVLEGLRRRGAGHVDVVVARHGGRDVAEAVAGLRRRHEPRLTLAPPGHRVPGASVAVDGSAIGVGPLSVRIDVEGQRVEATVSPIEAVGRAGGGGRPPPV